MSRDDRHRAAPAARVARFLSYLVHWYLVVVELILGLTFLLLLLGANPDSEFARWIYRSGHRAMDPFRGLFQPINFPTSADDAVAPVFDTSLLFAMIIYGLVLLAADSAIAWFDRRIRSAELDQAIAAQTQSYQASSAAPPSRPPDLVGQATRSQPTPADRAAAGTPAPRPQPTRPHPSRPDTPSDPSGGAR
ncbi:MAG: hypothetical protein ACK5PP_06600 [Acidimicrobiales bacterium]